MKVKQRRVAIANTLLASNAPISGSELSNLFNVSRQIIVSDITELKRMGYAIIATHHGYIMQKSPFKERVFKVKHTSQQTEEELNCIVNLGGTVVDVFVWHKVYGKMVAPLNIFSINQVKQFIDGVRSGKSSELMGITDGYHYHTVRGESEEVLDRIESALREKGYIVKEK